MNDELPQWDVPGWDWDKNDYSWLSSHSGLHENDTSIFFIHGGRIRHQAHLPHGYHPLEEFIAMLRERAVGLDEPMVFWLEDTGGGDCGLWVDGTRPPNDSDLARLQAARKRQRQDDERALRDIQRRNPDLKGG